MKVAMIGAGSIIFCKTLMMDIMSINGVDGGVTFSLMSPTESKLRRMESFANEVIRENSVNAKVEATTDRRKALAGADYVIIMIQVGGVDAFKVDYEIPMKYGVDQCIGDSMGPGGIFRGLRTIPVLLDIARDVMELCPNAIVLNYANPMAVNCWALGTVPGLNYVGLCHGVQTTLDLIASYADVKKEDIDFQAAGMNHMAWFLKLSSDGRDLYPILREKFEKPEYYINEKVRGEVFRHFGYFMTESTGHLSEYLPWFRKSAEAMDLYCDQPDFGGATGAYYHYCAMLSDKFSGVDALALESKKLEKRSAEYCSYIIEAVETDRVFRLNGNVRNDGFITNLPDGCCVEVPIYADRNGLNPTVVGKLPPQLAACNMTNVTVQGLAVEAAITGNADLACQAIALDPLTSAVLTLKESRDMAREMFSAEAQWLPQFSSMPADLPVISTPKGTVGVDVPVDPALAIANRFGKLASVSVKE